MTPQDEVDKFLLMSKEEKENFLKEWKENIEVFDENITVTLVGDFWCPRCKRFWMETDPIVHVGNVERFEYIPDEDAIFPEMKRFDTCPICKNS